MVVAVAAALGGLEVVGLRGLYGAQARAAAHHVHHEGGQLRCGKVAYAFLLEAHAGRRRRCHHGFAGGGAAVHHIDGRHFAFGLEHHHACGLPGLELGQSLEYFRLGGDGVAEVAVHAVADGCVGDGFVALHQSYFFFHSCCGG